MTRPQIIELIISYKIQILGNPFVQAYPGLKELWRDQTNELENYTTVQLQWELDHFKSLRETKP